MFAWQATVQDDLGNAVPLPVVTVYEYDGVTLASIYAEDQVTPLDNPFTGTLEGFVQFWANAGTYKIIGANGLSETQEWSVFLDTPVTEAIAQFGLIYDSFAALEAQITSNTAKETNATHTGDVTGSVALTIANNAVSNAKLADMATARIKGRSSAGIGDPEDLDAAAVRAILGLLTSAEYATADQGAKADAMYGIGHPFPVLDHIPGCQIPSNAGAAKFIKLTAGLLGSGAYNEGLLSSESVSGTAPAITATATIVGGPMNGQTVALVNTEQAFIRPSTVSGVLQASQNLSHVHPARVGMMEYVGTGGNLVAPPGSNLLGYSATLASGGDEARPRNRSATFYMRII